MSDMDESLRELARSQRSIESLLLQGSGAVKLARWIVAGAAIIGAGWVGHGRVGDFLEWLGGSGGVAGH